VHKHNTGTLMLDYSGLCSKPTSVVSMLTKFSFHTAAQDNQFIFCLQNKSKSDVFVKVYAAFGTGRGRLRSRTAVTGGSALWVSLSAE